MELVAPVRRSTADPTSKSQNSFNCQQQQNKHLGRNWVIWECPEWSILPQNLPEIQVLEKRKRIILYSLRRTSFESLSGAFLAGLWLFPLTEGFPEPPGLRRRQAWLIFILPNWQISVGFSSGLGSWLNFPSCCWFLLTLSPFLVGRASVLGCCTAPLCPQAPLLPSPSFRPGFLQGTAHHLSTVGCKGGCHILGNCSGLLPFMIPRY